MTLVHLQELLKSPVGALPGHARVMLFRDCRMVIAAIMFATCPLLWLVSGETIGEVLALVLFGALPAIIAMGVKRPSDLDRAVIMSFAATAAVLSAGVIKGLPAAPTMMLVALCAIEGCIVGTRKSRLNVVLIAAVSLFGIFGAAVALQASASPDAAHGSTGATGAVLAIAAVVHIVTTARSLIKSWLTMLQTHRQQRVLNSDVEAAVSETVLSVDKTGCVIRVSNNSERLLGLPVSSLMGRGLAELALVADRPVLLKSITDCASYGTPNVIRVRIRINPDDQSPTYRWIEAGMRPGLVSGSAVVTLRDVSELAAEEERQTQAISAAEQARSARAAFLQTVNHELRTPLNAIIGFSDILANEATTPKDPAKVREYAKIVNGAGQDLMRMVSAMIDITRIDSGIYEFEPEVMDIREIVEAAVETYRQEFGAETTSFDIVAEAAPLEAKVDMRAMRSILHELMSNAVKFRPQKLADADNSVVTIKMTSEADGVGIAVIDKGTGMAPDKLALLSQHFGRFDETLSREHGGIGLGLSRTRGLAALHHASITIESAPGQGTTVKLVLPSAGGSLVRADNVVALIKPEDQPETPSRPTKVRRSA